jgi:hypothetical protein
MGEMSLIDNELATVMANQFRCADLGRIGLRCLPENLAWPMR